MSDARLKAFSIRNMPVNATITPNAVPANVIAGPVLNLPSSHHPAKAPAVIDNATYQPIPVSLKIRARVLGHSS